MTQDEVQNIVRDLLNEAPGARRRAMDWLAEEEGTKKRRAEYREREERVKEHNKKALGMATRLRNAIKKEGIHYRSTADFATHSFPKEVYVTMSINAQHHLYGVEVSLCAPQSATMTRDELELKVREVAKKLGYTTEKNRYKPNEIAVWPADMNKDW